ncbi:MAG: hypothetical protein ACI9W4_001063 [Rhodothermales bacterium]|jgi:hypothetical protein
MSNIAKEMTRQYSRQSDGCPLSLSPKPIDLRIQARLGKPFAAEQSC